MRKQAAMKRAALALVLFVGTAVGTAFALPSAPAEATTATIYDIAAATATPRFSCTEFGCGALTGYTYTGEGACSAGCVGFPPGRVAVTLNFSVASTFPPSPCRMKSGTGTLDASWPDDPTLPAAQGRSRSTPTIPTPWCSLGPSPPRRCRCCSPVRPSGAL
jgi:uncharacterized low-complexity protein